MALRKGKVSVQAVVKEETVKKLDEIAEKEVTSRSQIAARIIEENIDKYSNEKEES